MDRNKGGPDGPYRGPYGTGDRLATIVNILQAPKAGIRGCILLSIYLIIKSLL